MRETLQELSTFLLLAIGGGLMAFMIKVPSKERTYLRLIIQISCALFTSFIMHSICKQFQWCAPGTNWYVAVIGIAGYSSRTILQIIDRQIVQRLRIAFGLPQDYTDNDKKKKG